MKALYFFAVLLCSPHIACATEEWLTIPNNDPNITFSVDKSSIERQGDVIRLWEKLVYTQPKTKDEASGKMVKEKKVHRLMNCADHTQGVITGVSYTENGRFISSVTYDEPQALSSIPPGTLAAEQLRLVCAPTSSR